MARCWHEHLERVAIRATQFALPAFFLSLIVDCRHKDGHRIYALIPLPPAVQGGLGALLGLAVATFAFADWRHRRVCRPGPGEDPKSREDPK